MRSGKGLPNLKGGRPERGTFSGARHIYCWYKSVCNSGTCSKFSSTFCLRYAQGQIKPGIDRLYHSRDYFDNIDDSLMLSSIISRMHQFYIEYRNYWWRFDVTSMFHPWFDCLSTFMPTLFRRININGSSGF